MANYREGRLITRGVYMKSILFFVGLIVVLIGIFGGIPLALSGDIKLVVYVILVICFGLILIGLSGIIERLDKIIMLKEKNS